MTVIGIMIGGALGSLARYLVGVWMGGVAVGQAASVPTATLLVNVSGSFLLSLLATMGLQGSLSPALRIALGTGFVGAFTTFSTFELEADMLLRQGQSGSLALYVLGNLVLGYLAVLIGRAVAWRLIGNA